MRETDDILARLAEGVASEDEIRLLVAEMREDAELCRRVANTLHVHGALGVALSNEIQGERWRQSVMNRVRDIDRETFVQGVHRRIRTTWWTVRLAGVAAAVTLMAALCWSLLRQTRLAPEEPRIRVATLTRAEEFDDDDLVRHHAGSVFHVGDTIRMERGLVELDLEGRGRLVLEGPAHLVFPEPHRAVLKHGRVVMRATLKGHGYRIDTPMGGVTDLGTEFGISVDDKGVVETHVLDGKVEAVANNGKRMILKRDEALRFNPGGEERIPADSTGFYTQLPPERTGAANYVHWSMDRVEGDSFTAVSKGLGGDHPEMALRNVVGGQPPRQVDGVFGSAASFDGLGAYLESGFRGVGGAEPRTVCMWVRIDKPTEFRHGYGIVSWGRYHPDRPGEAWQISANTDLEDGPTGRLRVGLHKGQVIGSTNLRDGTWHHLAVVLYGGSSPDVGTHVLLYVDGKLENISTRALRKVRTEVRDADRGVWVGRHMVTSTDGKGFGNWEYFKGEVDEVYIFNAALSQAEIQRIMSSNLPPEK